MRLIKGIDLGNGYCKFGNNKRFASKIKPGSLQDISGDRIKTNKELHQVEFEGENYIVGTGNSFIGRQRYYSNEYLITLLTAISLSAPDNKKDIAADIVLGMPIEHYKADSEKVEKYLNEIGSKKITVDGCEYNITIKKITVFVESAAPIKDNDNRHIVTIDVGEGTINIIEWNNQEIIESYTNNGSFNEMYFEMSKFLNQKYGTSLNPNDCVDLIRDKKLNTDNEKNIDISKDVNSILKGTISNLLSYTGKIDFSGADAIQIFGGGASATFDIWKSFFNAAELISNGQFINQQVYQSIAEALEDEE